MHPRNKKSVVPTALKFKAVHYSTNYRFYEAVRIAFGIFLINTS